ncbi:MAG: hypothetical protein WCI01_07075 [Chlorobiaceae bacterium]
MNKQFARVALSDDDLIEKVDRELNKIRVVVPQATGPGSLHNEKDHSFKQILNYNFISLFVQRLLPYVSIRIP